MKKILLLIFSIILMIPTSFAQDSLSTSPLKVHKSENKFATMFQLGVSYSKLETIDESNDFGSKLFFNGNINGRYAFNEYIGSTFGIGKWFGDGEFSSNAGGFSYGLSLGLTFSLSGSLINETTVNSSLSRRKVNKNGKYYYITNTERTTVRNDLDGFRLDLRVNQQEFSKLNEPVYGLGASLFYEQRIKENKFLQYGVKFDNINNRNVEVNLFQVFVGFGAFP